MSSSQALDLTDVEEALPETTLTSLPDELFLLIAKFLLERDLAGVCLLGATSKARTAGSYPASKLAMALLASRSPSVGTSLGVLGVFV